MYIDFIIALILIVCIIAGDKRGFIKTAIGTFGWIFSSGGAWILRERFITTLDTRTTIREDLTAKVVEIIKLEMMKKAADLPQGEDLPSTIATALTRAADRAVAAQAEAAATPIVNALIGVLSFLVLFIIFKTILFFVQHGLMKLTSKGPLSVVDSIGGIICGFVQGLLIAYILLMIVIFIAVIGNIPLITEQVTNSVTVGFLHKFGLTPFSSSLNTLLSM